MPFSESAGGDADTIVPAEFLALLGTVDVNQWKLQGEKEEGGGEDRAGGREQPGTWRMSVSLYCAGCSRRERKATGAVGEKKRWSVHDAEMPEHCQGVSTKASLTSFTRAVTVSYTSTVLFV